MRQGAICVTGASGLVGTRLVNELERNGQRLVVVGRSPTTLIRRFPAAEACLGWEDLPAYPMDDVSAIINLAGASVMGAKWTRGYKAEMISSRIDATKVCVELCRSAPHVDLLNASAISAYGFYTNDCYEFSEDDADKRSGRATFLQTLIDAWEQATEPARDTGVRIVLLRLGVVFTPEEAVLPVMAKSFRSFMGGPIGTGEQVMSWISVEDLISALIFLLNHRDIDGPVNLVSPGACQNAEFARALGRALRRPSFIRTPGFVIKAIMGQMGDELVLHGQRVTPKKLEDAGFTFRHSDVYEYLREAYSKHRRT